MNASHPLFIYISVWSLVLGLASLRMTANLYALNSGTLLLVGANVATFAIWFLMLPSPGIKRTPKQLRQTMLEAMPSLGKFLGITSTLWFFGTVIEVGLCGGVPLMWAFTQGFEADYTHFGIPSLHGFLNSLYLFSITARFLRYLVLKQKNDLLITACMLCWPVMMLAAVFFLAHSARRQASISRSFPSV